MNGANLLIINSLQGGGGHRLGRIFSCFHDVYWYAHDNNGWKPWEFALNKEIGDIADAQTKDLSRMYYIPAKYKKAFNFIFSHNGAIIDPDALMEKQK